MSKHLKCRPGKAGKQSVAKSGQLVTLAMIVKNEEQFLAGCLESAKPYVDEIVIVDTGSTDGTKAIAESFGARVIDHEWKNDFAEARNVSLDHARGKWVLWLDADERLCEGSGQLVRECAEAGDDIGGFLVTITNQRDDDGKQLFIHQACRMFRLLPEVRFYQRIHEQIVQPILRQGLSIANSEIIIDHFGYAPSVSKERGKDERNAELLRIALEENPENYWLGFKQASMWASNGRFEDAIELYAKVAENGGASIVGTELFYEWADTLTTVGRPHEAVQVCDRASGSGVVHPELSYVKARAYLAMEHYLEAIECFKEAIDLGQKNPLSSGDSGTWGVKAYDGLAAAYAGTGDWATACEYAAKSLEQSPENSNSMGLLAKGYSVLGRFDKSIEVLEHITTVTPDEPHAYSDLAEMAIRDKEYAKARLYLEKLVKLVPSRFEFHLKLGSVYEELSLSEMALVEYRRTMNLQPKCIYAYNNIARITAANGNYQEALNMTSQAIDLNPRWAPAYFTTGDILYKAGLLEDAKSAYERGLQLDPKNAEGYVSLGEIYFKQEAYKAAEMANHLALAVCPGYPVAERNLALVRGIIGEQDSITVKQDVVSTAA